MNYSQSADDDNSQSLNNLDNFQNINMMSADNDFQENDDIHENNFNLGKFNLSSDDEFSKNKLSSSNKSKPELNQNNQKKQESGNGISAKSKDVTKLKPSIDIFTTPKRNSKRKNINNQSVIKNVSESNSFYSPRSQNKELNQNIQYNEFLFETGFENLPPITRVQNRIIQYLSLSLNNLIAQFKDDLQLILEQADLINNITNRFLLTLNSEIKRSVQTHLNMPSVDFSNQELQKELFNIQSEIDSDLKFEIPKIKITKNYDSLFPIIGESQQTKQSINRIMNEYQSELQNLINERNESVKALRNMYKNQRGQFRKLRYQEQFLIEKRYDQFWRSKFIQKRKEDYQSKLIRLQSLLQIRQNKSLALLRSKEKIKESKFYLFDDDIGIITSMKSLLNECEQLKKLRSSISLKNDAFNDNLLLYASAERSSDLADNNATIFDIPISPIHASNH